MRAAVLGLALLASACAAGHVRPDGTLVGVAVGDAVVESCEEGAFAPDGTPIPPACARIRGGTLSSNFGDIAAAALAAFGAWFAF